MTCLHNEVSINLIAGPISWRIPSTDKLYIDKTHDNIIRRIA